MNNKEIIQSMYNSFASGDVAAVTAAFADDISWTEADGFPLAGTYIGPQAVVENVFMRLGEFSDNWSVVVERLIGDGDTVIIDVGAEVDGYRSDMTRSFVLGEPDLSESADKIVMRK